MKIIENEEAKKRIKEVLNELTTDFKKRKSFFRKAALFRESVAEEMIRGLPDYDWFIELGRDRQFVAKVGRNPDIQSSVMTWTVGKFRQVSDVSNWFRPSEALVYKLLATDLKGALVDDLKLPYEAFYIELPEDLFYIEDKKTGSHSVRHLTLSVGRITQKLLDDSARDGDNTAHLIKPGKRLLIEAYGEPNSSSDNPFDDVWVFHSYDIDDPAVDIETTIAARAAGYYSNPGRLGEKPLGADEIRETLLRFVLNFCIYLGSEKVKVEHTHKAELERLHGGKKFKNLRQNIQEKIKTLQRDKIFDVGTDVSVDLELREMVRTEGTGGSKLAYRTLVRGHWRLQAHGPKRALRTRKWIEPHVRGKDLVTKIMGHNYEVE